MKLSRGFTLIEVLLTIGALTLLSVALVVVINPAVELQKIRDTRRAAQVDTIYGALENYFAVNGTYPQGVLQLDNGSSIEICASGIPQATCQNDGLLFLSGALEPDFVSQIPTDSQATGNSSGFSIQKNVSGQIGVSAPLVEFRDEVVAGAKITSGIVGTLSNLAPGMEIVPNGLVHFYDFNLDSEDQTTNTEDLTVTGAENYVIDPRGQSSVEDYVATFDGSSWYSTGQSTMNSYTSFSLTAWFQNTNGTIGSRTALIGQNDAVEVCFWNSGDLGMWMSGTGITTRTNAPYTDGQWYHVVFTYDSTNGEASMYLNGTLQDTTIDSTPGSSTSGSAFNVGQGACDSSGGEFTGNIDDVRIYDRELTPAEVTELYNY